MRARGRPVGWVLGYQTVAVECRQSLKNTGMRARRLGQRDTVSAARPATFLCPPPMQYLYHKSHVHWL